MSLFVLHFFLTGCPVQGGVEHCWPPNYSISCINPSHFTVSDGTVYGYCSAEGQLEAIPLSCAGVLEPINAVNTYVHCEPDQIPGLDTTFASGFEGGPV